MFGMTFGAVSVMDEMSYRLDKCETREQYLNVDLDECKGDLKLCELRQGPTECTTQKTIEP